MKSLLMYTVFKNVRITLMWIIQDPVLRVFLVIALQTVVFNASLHLLLAPNACQGTTFLIMSVI